MKALQYFSVVVILIVLFSSCRKARKMKENVYVTYEGVKSANFINDGYSTYAYHYSCPAQAKESLIDNLKFFLNKKKVKEHNQSPDYFIELTDMEIETRNVEEHVVNNCGADWYFTLQRASLSAQVKIYDENHKFLKTLSASFSDNESLRYSDGNNCDEPQVDDMRKNLEKKLVKDLRGKITIYLYERENF